MSKNQEFVKATSQILKDNPEWESIYERYADFIIKNSGKYVSDSRLFQVNKPITVYSTIGKVISGSSNSCYDLRFAGQSIGKIEVNKGEKVCLSVSEEQVKHAKKIGFKSAIALNHVDWKTDKNAKEFRRFYYSQESTQNIQIKSEEHRIENWMLREFSKRTRAEHKLLCNIQPVCLGSKFFQLTTPLKASTHKPEISLTSQRNGANGGGIDILARIKHQDNTNHLAIIELKDENRVSESQEVAMFQALTYSTFIAHLLRSSSGIKWWNIFREDYSTSQVKSFNSNRPIELDVITLMPVGESTEGELDPIVLESLNVRLNLYTLFYNKDSNGNPSSFVGSLLDIIKH